MSGKSEEQIVVASYKEAFTRYEKIREFPENDEKLPQLEELETDLLRIIEQVSDSEPDSATFLRVLESTYAILAETLAHKAFFEPDEKSQKSIEGAVSSGRKALEYADQEKDLGYANFIRSGLSYTFTNALLLSDPPIRQEIIDLLITTTSAFDKAGGEIDAASREGIIHYNTGTILKKEFEDLSNLYERGYFFEQAQQSFQKSANCFLTAGNMEFLERAEKMAESLGKEIKSLKSDPAYTGPAKKPNDQVGERLSTALPDMISCTTCGISNPVSSKFCTNCGVHLQPSPEPITKPSPIYCKNCGNPVTPGTKFCKSCGAPVEGPAPMAVCPGCGSPAAPGKKFCSTCGARLGN